MTAFSALLAAVVVAQAAPAAPPAASPPPRPAPVARRVEGKVTFATATTAYLDAGAHDGVTPGQAVRLTRAGQAAGTCTVREVGDHFATCAGPGLRVGDRFVLETTVAGEPPVARLPAIPTDEDLERQGTLVATAPVLMVESKAQPRPVTLGQLPVLRGDLGYVLWYANSGSPDQNAQRVQVDLQVNGLDVVEGFKLYADARVMAWTQRNADSVPGTAAQLLVYDLELAMRDRARPWTAAVGRVQPWGIPGASVFDGVQGGWRLGRNEVGVFGGLVPDTWSTAPTVKNYTGGVYGSFEVPLDRFLLNGRARVAAVGLDQVNRYEGELALNFWAEGVVGVNGDLRLGFGDVTAPSSIDAARLYLTVRPVPTVNISGGFSYWGLDLGNEEPIATWPGPSRRADGSVSVDATDWIRIAVLGGWVDDLTSGLTHEYVGPEVTFPRVLNGLSFGYLQDFGWVEGQNAWGQVNWSPMADLRLMGRLSWWATTATVAGLTAPSAANDLGLTLTATAPIWKWLSMRASLMVRGGIDTSYGENLPWGTVASLFLVGTY